MTTKFKKGDIVKIKSGNDGYAYSFMYKNGDILKITQDDSTCPNTVRVSDGETGCASEKYLELFPRSLDTLEVGDILVGEYGDKLKVLAVLPGVILRSGLSNYEAAGSWYTIEELKKGGWTVEDTTEPEDTAAHEAIALLKEKGYVITKEK